MHLQLHRDLDHHDLVHHLVHDLVRHLLMDHLDDMDRYLLVRRYRYVEDIVNLEHQLDVVKMDALQNLDEQNQGVVLTFQVVVRHFLADVQVGVELHHLLKMDCYLDEVGVEPHHLLKMDCYLDEVLALAHQLQVRSHQIPVVLRMVRVLLPLLQLLREMPLAHRDQRRALLPIQRQVLDPLLPSSLQRSFSLLPS